jgi:hypothetical protein
LEKFLRETEYLHEKPARRRFSGSKAGWALVIASLGVVSLIAVAAFSLLH